MYFSLSGHAKQAGLFDDLRAKLAPELDYENEPNFHYMEHAKTLAVTLAA